MYFCGVNGWRGGGIVCPAFFSGIDVHHQHRDILVGALTRESDLQGGPILVNASDFPIKQADRTSPTREIVNNQFAVGRPVENVQVNLVALACGLSPGLAVQGGVGGAVDGWL